MAIDVATAKAAAIAAVKAQLDIDFATAAPDADTGLQFLADAIGEAIEVALDEIKDNADLTGVTSGGDTVAGGVD